MKVLHFVNENRLSWANPWVQLLSFLQGKGIKNVVLCNPGGTLGSKIESAGIPVVNYKPLVSSLPCLCKRAGGLIEEIKPDLIHTRLSSAAMIGGYWGKKLGIPVISTIDKYSKRKYSRRSDHLVAVSDSVRQWLVNTGHDPETISVIFNPLNCSQYSKDLKVREKFREDHNVREEEFIITGAGRFVEWKGFDVLLNAVCKLPDTIPFRLWLAGDGSELKKLQGIAENDPRLSGKVTFWGFVKDVRPLLWASDIFVLPSREPEPFGLILLEAMSSGLPVIATSAGGPLDMVNKDSGCLVPPGDIRALSKSIEQCMGKKNLQKMGRAALVRSKQFDVKQIGDEYLELYSRFCTK